MDGLPFGPGHNQDEFIWGWYDEYRNALEWADEFLAGLEIATVAEVGLAEAPVLQIAA